MEVLILGIILYDMVFALPARVCKVNYVECQLAGFVAS